MSRSIPIRVLSKRDVESLLTPDEILETVEQTFRALGEGSIFHPVKEPIWLDEEKHNMLIAMPAYLRQDGVVGMKWINLFEKQQPGLPSSYGNILVLNHPENGQPYAIMEATSITTCRTAGGHGVVAAKYLARKDSKVIAMIGCGEEAKAGVRSFLTTFPQAEELRVCDIRAEAMAEMERLFGDRIRVVACPDAKDAVASADIVMLVTTSRKPIVRFDWLKKGAFVAGLYQFYDLDPACSRRADKWVLGSKDTDKHQIVLNPLMAEHHLSMDDVYADLGEIVAGKVPGRTSDDEIIVYTHMGMGALDVAVGDLAYRRAEARNVGTIIDLS
ncbi:ornithine cyclodeaminase family protein [Intestinimonas butyriciproducens]|uniref:ornithine cyclodeaminase family protein n=1 Tax=Intestinimonas butyriciproducens TaxID=1297617 RepID=UPI0034E4FBFD